MKQILYDMGNFFWDHNPSSWPYNYVISGRYRHRTSVLRSTLISALGRRVVGGGGVKNFFIALFHVSEHVGYFKAIKKNLLRKVGHPARPPPTPVGHFAQLWGFFFFEASPKLHDLFGFLCFMYVYQLWFSWDT